MKITECISVDKYYEYIKYINDCKKMPIDLNVVYHIHHIIPKFMGGTDEKDNLIQLTVEQHSKAHILLSECFDCGTKENVGNVRAALVIDKKSIKLLNDLSNFYTAYCGENNPFYGKSHTVESIKKMINTRISNGNTRKGISYEEFYKEKSYDERIKRRVGVSSYWQNVNKDERINRGNKIRESRKHIDSTGRNNPYANVMEIDGILFYCWNDAIKYFNMSRYKICKKYNVTIIGKVKDL